MKGVGVMSASLKLVFEQGLAASPQYDIEAVGEALQRARCIEVESCRQTIGRRLVGDGCDDGIVGDQRIALEIHLGYQSLRKARSEHREMDVGRPPAVDAIPERVCAGLDGPEEVIAPFIGQHPAAATEIRIDRRDIGVVAVAVASTGVGLPYFDKRVGYRLAIAVEHIAVDDRLLADRLALFGIIEDEIVIERTEFAGREYRTGYFGQRVLQRPKRDARGAQYSRLGNGRVRGRMNVAIALVKLGLGRHDAVTSCVWLTVGSLLPPSFVLLRWRQRHFWSDRAISIDIAALQLVFSPQVGTTAALSAASVRILS